VSDVETLRETLATLHARIDEWAAAVEGVAVESDGDSAQAMADPRLEAAQERFYEGLARFEDASLPVLGVVREQEQDAQENVEFPADDFFLHFLVGIAPSAPRERFEEAFELIHQAGHALVDQLVDAGFAVPTFAASRGEPDLTTYDEDREEDG
jgi:hypothetical protein